MRIFIDVTDLQRRTRDKYDRLVRRLAQEAAAAGGVAVELREGGGRIVAAQPIADEAAPRDWRTTPWLRSFSVEKIRRAAKLAMRFAAWRFLGHAPGADEKDSLAWDFAYCIEVIPPGQRKLLGDFLDLGANAGRNEKFHHWLGERARSGQLVEISDETETEELSPQNGDLLILAGASWGHVNIDALEALKLRTGLRLAFYVNDLLPIDYPSLVTTRQRGQFSGFILGAARIADAIAAPGAMRLARLDAFLSEHGADAKPRRGTIDVRSAALADMPAARDAPPPRIAALREDPFILCPSALRERKHVLWLYGICAKLRAAKPHFPRLVIAGRADDMRVLRILLSDLAWESTARFVENPSDAELRWLYGNARLCLYPSFEGGLGMPIMEAENFLLPCIAANNAALSEAGGQHTLFLPRDEAQWGQAIWRLLDETQKRDGDARATHTPLLEQFLALVNK